MSGFIPSKWQGEKTRIPGLGISLSPARAKSLVDAALPQLPANVQQEAREFMAGKRQSVSVRSESLLRLAFTSHVLDHYRR